MWARNIGRLSFGVGLIQSSSNSRLESARGEEAWSGAEVRSELRALDFQSKASLFTFENS